MKTIALLAFWLFLLSTFTVVGQQITTATLTITNVPTGNTNTITVNGTTRTWTNTVTTALQIQTTNTIIQSWTNIFYNYAATPVSAANLSASSTNIIQWQSFPGQPLTASISVGWGTLVFTTNSLIGTNSGVMRYPPAITGVYEQTNVENALIAYLNDNKMTNTLNSAAPAFVNFLQITALNAVSNTLRTLAFQIGQANSNLTWTIGGNGTNYAFALWLNNSNQVFNATNGIPNNSAQLYSVSYFQPACAVLSNVCALGTLQGLSYIEAGTGNILLANTNGVTRLQAYDPNGVSDSGYDFYLNYEDGNNFFHQDSSHNLFWFDHSGTKRIEQDDPATTTTYWSVSSGGNDVLRSGSGNAGIVLNGTDTVGVNKSLTFHNATCPTVAMGTVTNFCTSQQNSGSGLNSYNYVSIPANTMTNNGDSLIRTIGVTYNANASAKDCQISFGGSTILDTGAIANSGSGGSSIMVELTVQNASTLTSATIAYRCQAISTGTSTSVKSSSGTVGSVNLVSGSPDFHINLQAVGGSTGDIHVDTDNTRLAPSANWQGF